MKDIRRSGYCFAHARKGCTFSLFRSVKVMMAASCAKDDRREEKKEPPTVTEEGSKPISTSDLSLHMAGTMSSKEEHRR